MFHVLLFVSVCVIVAYACIAFRDDPHDMDPFEGMLRRCDPQMTLQSSFHRNGTADSSKQRMAQCERRPFIKAAL